MRKSLLNVSAMLIKEIHEKMMRLPDGTKCSLNYYINLRRACTKLLGFIFYSV